MMRRVSMGILSQGRYFNHCIEGCLSGREVEDVDRRVRDAGTARCESVQALPTVAHPDRSSRNALRHPCIRLKGAALIIDANGGFVLEAASGRINRGDPETRCGVELG